MHHCAFADNAHRCIMCCSKHHRSACICCQSSILHNTAKASRSLPRVMSCSKEKKSKKENMGMVESFTFLAKSTYIRCIATLVVSYGIAINIVEVRLHKALHPVTFGLHDTAPSDVANSH